ncbi:MAG TPA: hypothetical protein DDW76_31355 [Cyanobacteria bacterium UBA11369]|nr:hypothetical protein [Cyanobacteria bacterium UBA11368]HBE53139.1 hypothetical protein [Cyanobacteria bacterium UBA11369]
MFASFEKLAMLVTRLRPGNADQRGSASGRLRRQSLVSQHSQVEPGNESTSQRGVFSPLEWTLAVSQGF